MPSSAHISISSKSNRKRKEFIRLPSSVALKNGFFLYFGFQQPCVPGCLMCVCWWPVLHSFAYYYYLSDVSTLIWIYRFAFYWWDSVASAERKKKKKKIIIKSCSFQWATRSNWSNNKKKHAAKEWIFDLIFFLLFFFGYDFAEERIFFYWRNNGFLYTNVFAAYVSATTSFFLSLWNEQIMEISISYMTFGDSVQRVKRTKPFDGIANGRMVQYVHFWFRAWSSWTKMGQITKYMYELFAPLFNIAHTHTHKKRTKEPDGHQWGGDVKCAWMNGERKIVALIFAPFFSVNIVNLYLTDERKFVLAIYLRCNFNCAAMIRRNVALCGSFTRCFVIN